MRVRLTHLANSNKKNLVLALPIVKREVPKVFSGSTFIWRVTILIEFLALGYAVAFIGKVPR